MKRRLIYLLTVLITVGMLSFPSNALCANCDQAHNDCGSQSIQELNDCCNVFGCNNTWSVNYCADKANEVYVGCMVLKACTPRNN